MGLRITRSKRNDAISPRTSAFKSDSSSIFSARDLCPVDIRQTAMPDHVEVVVPDETGHVGATIVASIFDRLWEVSRVRGKSTIEIDLTQVRSADSSFAGELEFLRRILRQSGGEVRTMPEHSHLHFCH